MTFLAGSLYGVSGSALYQLVIVNNFRQAKRKWPWQDRRRGITLPFYTFSVIVRLVVAFALVGLMAGTGQISGPWAAVISGMVADVIVIKLADAVRKEYAK